MNLVDREGELFHFRSLSKEAREGIALLYDSLGLEEPHAWMPIHEAAIMFFRLRHAEDMPEYFPKGKWATIQQLEILIDQFYGLTFTTAGRVGIGTTEPRRRRKVEVKL